tara:strand:- start:437 stop:1198 length:762 start_codon:yes stop_codon:yes gene_type:complete
MKVIFTNDNNAEIQLINHKFTKDFIKRDDDEVLFRRINTFLINEKIIKNNVIDLGAWCGDNTIPWAMNLPESIIYAIDPSSRNINFIKEMASVNKLNNIKLIQVAVSDKLETLSTNDNIEHCSFVYNNPINNGKHKEYAVTLDSLHDDGDIKDIGMIHLDVEGMEYRVMKGAEKIINMYKPVITFEQHLEIDNYDIISNYLKKKNYKIFLINEILPSCRPDCRNSIAIPNHLYSADLIKKIHDKIAHNLLLER